MKTFEDVLAKAVSIADNDTNARVALIDLRVRQKLPRPAEWVGNGNFNVVQGLYKSARGGEVRFYDAGQELYPVMAGAQFTHVFHSEYVSATDQKYASSRIRYHEEPSPEPAGTYNFYGIVTRTQAW